MEQITIVDKKELKKFIKKAGKKNIYFKTGFNIFGDVEVLYTYLFFYKDLEKSDLGENSLTNLQEKIHLVTLVYEDYTQDIMKKLEEETEKVLVQKDGTTIAFKIG